MSTANDRPLQRPDVRLLLMPLPDSALLPFGAFLDKLRFSADEADRSRQRYCAWTLMGVDSAPVVSSSGAQVTMEATPDSVDLAAARCKRGWCMCPPMGPCCNRLQPGACPSWRSTTPAFCSPSRVCSKAAAWRRIGAMGPRFALPSPPSPGP